MENIENVESVKRIVKSNLKMYLIGNIKGSHEKEILQIFYKSLQFVCKLKIQQT